MTIPFLSSNRTLFVLPLSGQQKEAPTFIKELSSLKAVFGAYQPSCTVDFFNEQGEMRQETIVFNNMLDFYPEQIIANSPFLNTLENEALLQQNLTISLRYSHPLEQNYRVVQSFFRNCSNDRALEELTFLDVNLTTATEEDFKVYQKLLERELSTNVYTDDLSNHYSLLVIPGFIANPSHRQQLGQMAYEHKVMCLTDYRNTGNIDLLLKHFQEEMIHTQALGASHLMMTCNWLTGRKPSGSYGEQFNGYFPASGALAGLLVNNSISQLSAGFTHGVLHEVEGVRLEPTKAEVGKMVELGLIPIIQTFGKHMAYSTKTLFKGEGTGSTMYPFVRIFDWLQKCLMHYLNQRVGENKLEESFLQELQKEIHQFLEKCIQKGYLQSFGAIKLSVAAENTAELNLITSICPTFLEKDFVLSLAADFS